MWLIALLLLSIIFIVTTTSAGKWHPFLSLIIAAFGYGLLSGTMTLTEVVNAVNDGFGSTVGYIGVVIVAGSIIGKFLEMSGGAYTLANSALKRVGGRNMPLALTIVGYFVSIPVFCDSGFIVLSPLSKALARKAGISLAVLAVALSLGLYITHTLVPPTPGPVAAAGILGAELGLVILLGIPVSLVALLAAWVFSVRIASKVTMNPLHNFSDETVDDALDLPLDPPRPSLLKSLLPIFLPIFFIVMRSLGALPSAPFGQGFLSVGISFIGQPAVALMMGAGLSFLLPWKLKKEMLSSTGWVGQAIVAAAGIIIITGSGGAFGKVLQEAGIAEGLKTELSGLRSLGILLPILMAASLKIAQGSSTVAMITSASLMAPLLPLMGLDNESAKALVVVAAGAGSMIASHANDSYFWVVTQMSGMNVSQGYRLQTLGTLLTGICSAFAVWIISLWIL